LIEARRAARKFSGTVDPPMAGGESPWWKVLRSR